MVQLSNLPGRVRYELQSLIGNECYSRFVESKIKDINSVKSATVNHRTGRILISFDENQTDTSALKQEIKEIIRKTLCEPLPDIHISDNPGILGARCSFRKALTEAIVHALVPEPLGVLLPLAVKTARALY